MVCTKWLRKVSGRLSFLLQDGAGGVQTALQPMRWAVNNGHKLQAVFTSVCRLRAVRWANVRLDLDLFPERKSRHPDHQQQGLHHSHRICLARTQRAEEASEIDVLEVCPMPTVAPKAALSALVGESVAHVVMPLTG